MPLNCRGGTVKSPQALWSKNYPPRLETSIVKGLLVTQVAPDNEHIIVINDTNNPFRNLTTSTNTIRTKIVILQTTLTCQHACSSPYQLSTMDHPLHLTNQRAIMGLAPRPVVHNQVVSRAKIPAEILCMVVETVVAQDRSRSFELRLVSKQLNNLVTPLLYRHIILNGRFIISLVANRKFLSPHKRQVALDVRKYTWNVTLRGDFPDENLGSVFRSLKCLREIT